MLPIAAELDLMINITGTSYFFDRGRDRMTALNATADQLQAQISIGKRLTDPSQDSAAWQRLQGLVQAKADSGAYSANIDFARAVLEQTDATLGSIQTGLQRAGELALQANNGALSVQNRAVIADQLDALVADLTALGNTTDPRGLALFDANARPIPVADGIAVLANEDKTRVFGNVLTAITTFAGALRSSTSIASDAATAIAAINAGTANVANVQGTVGARAARVELVADNAAKAADLTEVQRKSVEDTDLTAAITDLQRTMTVLQATQASFSKLTSLSLFDYLR